MPNGLITGTVVDNGSIVTTSASVSYHGHLLRALAACDAVPVDEYQVDVRVPAALWALIQEAQHA